MKRCASHWKDSPMRTARWAKLCICTVHCGDCSQAPRPGRSAAGRSLASPSPVFAAASRVALHAVRNISVMQQPEAYIGNVKEVLDQQGGIKAAETDFVLKDFMSAFERWIGTFAKQSPHASDHFLAQRESISNAYISGNAEALHPILTRNDPRLSPARRRQRIRRERRPTKLRHRRQGLPRGWHRPFRRPAKRKQWRPRLLDRPSTRSREYPGQRRRGRHAFAHDRSIPLRREWLETGPPPCRSREGTPGISVRCRW